MPVRKFRTVEDMERPFWLEPGHPDLYRAIERVWAFGQRSGWRRFPPGVYRHGSIEQLNAQSEQWSLANFLARVERHE